MGTKDSEGLQPGSKEFPGEDHQLVPANQQSPHTSIQFLCGGAKDENRGRCRMNHHCGMSLPPGRERLDFKNKK